MTSKSSDQWVYVAAPLFAYGIKPAREPLTQAET